MEELKNEVEAYIREIEALKNENKKLKTDLRIIDRELVKSRRTTGALENNFRVKTNMFQKLVRENEKHQMFLTHLMKNSADFLILVDSDLSIAYCSDSFLNIIGASNFEQIENKKLLDIYNGFCDDILFAQFSDAFALAVDQDKTTRHDIVADIDKCGESRVYRITNTPMSDGDLNGVIVNWNDITDITNAKNEAEDANKSKSNFLATMSHEIRTPINAVIGTAQIQLRKRPPKEYADAFELIHDSGSNLLGIINDILDISKIEAGKMEINPAVCDLPNLIHDTVQLNIVRIGSKPIEFVLDVREDLPSQFIGDELRLKQILNNVLSNAIKYTEQGQVTLSVRHSMRDGQNLELRFTVEDTGQGMKPEDLANLFTEYSRFNAQTNRTVEGTGIGMNIAQKLAQMMNGVIEARSVYGKGSTFTITIIQEAVECAVIGPEITQKLKTFTFSGKKERRRGIRYKMPYGKVLIVDDVKTNLHVAGGLMSPYLLKIETAESGFEAIEKIEKDGAYDIVFMDHMMPVMDGIETTQKLREQGYGGIIIALTANALVGNAEMFKQNGFDDFVSKPIDVRLLDIVLNKYIRERRPQDAEQYNSASDDAFIDAASSEYVSAISPKLLEIFRQDAEKAVVTLRKTVINNDIKLFTTTVHAMKSALANIGEKEKSELAAALEKAGGSGDDAFISANIDGFIKSLEILIEKLTPEETGGSDSDISEDTDYLKEQLLIIKSACDGYDDDTAYQALDRLKEKQWKKNTSAMLENIRDMLFLECDFEGAAERAERYGVSPSP